MGLDDFFKQERNRHNNDHGYYGGHRNSYHGHHKGILQYLYLFEKLKNNGKLLKILVAVAIVVVIIAIAFVLMLIPLIMKLFGIIQKNGISGLIETAKPWLELLWSGSVK